MAGHVALDPPPAVGEVRIARRQAPYRMHVIREQNPAIDAKGLAGPDLQDGLPQSQADIRVGQYRLAPFGDNREEVAATRYACSPVIGHGDDDPCRAVVTASVGARRAGATRYVFVRSPREPPVRVSVPCGLAGFTRPTGPGAGPSWRCRAGATRHVLGWPAGFTHRTVVR